MAKTQENLSPGAWAALNALRKSEQPITLAEINDLTQVKISSGHMTALGKRGLVVGEKTEFFCPCCNNKTVKNVYTVTDAGQTYTE